MQLNVEVQLRLANGRTLEGRVREFEPDGLRLQMHQSGGYVIIPVAYAEPQHQTGVPFWGWRPVHQTASLIFRAIDQRFGQPFSTDVDISRRSGPESSAPGFAGRAESGCWPPPDRPGC